MKFVTSSTAAAVVSLVVAASAIIDSIFADANLSIRGNTKSANKLMAFSRRLEDTTNDYNNNNVYGEAANNWASNTVYGENSNNNAAANNNNNNANSYSYYGGNYGEMDEESMYFLNNYSIKLLGCIQGEQVINYENGEMESSTVLFRLCPANTCEAESSIGCEDGYGDFAVGIETFLEAYMEQQKENDNGNNNNNNNNNQQNQQQQQYYGNNGNWNSMIAYNNYGQEFDAEEYMECREFDVEEGQNQQQQQQQQYYNNYNYNNNGGNNNNNNNGQQQYNQNGGQYNEKDGYYYANNGNNDGGQGQYNGQYSNNGQQQGNYNNNGYQQNDYQNYQNMQFFIGPSCSEDGTTITLGMYLDEDCSYAATDVNFTDVAYGWDKLPFSDGGLVSLDCFQCYGPNENYEYELSKMCSESYESSTARCEANMESYSYYGQNTQGCDYVNGLAETVLYGRSSSATADDESDTDSMSWVKTTRFMDTLSKPAARAFIAAMVFTVSAFVGSCLVGYCCVQKRKKRKAKKRAASSPGGVNKADDDTAASDENEIFNYLSTETVYHGVN